MADAVSVFYAHPTAVLDEGCRVGAGSRIWHFCHLAAGAVLGENCSLGQNVFVASGVTLGRNVKVQNNVSLYEGVVCEDDVFIGPSAVFTNVRNPRAAVPRRGAAHCSSTRVKASSQVMVKRPRRSTRSSERDRCSPSSGRIARQRGSTQNTSADVRLSAIGKMPIA